MARTFRFAPSPTGYLHIGNARTALLNWLLAKKSGSRFILRLDDTDRERSTAAFAEAIVTDLAWLGIVPDAIERQSDRIAVYEAAAARLKADGRLYACYETPDELDRRRKRQLARGLPPIYDRASLSLTDEERRAYEAEGRTPHWRFRLAHRTVAWDDLVRGPSHVDTASLSDPVLVRADGSFLYTLPSVVDDIEMGVTDVIRGEDHVTNTGVQIEIVEALGSVPPAFGHHNLLTTASGEGLSKRLGHLSLKGLREAGIEPMAVASLAVLVGSSEAVRAIATMDDLAALADLGQISRAPAKFDEAELAQLNAQLLHAMPYGQALSRLAPLGIEGEDFWHAVRGNLHRFEDVSEWWQIVQASGLPGAALTSEQAVVVSAARQSLPPEPWDGGTWKTWTDLIKSRTGAKGRALFMPLRLVLTGREHGPELAALLPLIGLDRATERLDAALRLAG